jgi:glycosyltransferase involved in cell wall biosynthesis
MTGNRIAWAGAWSRGHNNSRYEELLPRLSNVDRYYIDLHPWWPVRGLRRRIWLPMLTAWIGIRYPLIWSTDWRAVRWIRNRVVVDHDDPLFTPEEIRVLNVPNVSAVVVTSDAAKKRFLEMGLRSPLRIIPQGVAIQPVDAKKVRAIRSEWNRAKDEIVTGIHQPQFALSAELPTGAAQQMYAVDPLLQIMERARKKNPRLVLWLVGEPSPRVRQFADRNPWVRLPGYRPRPELMEFVAAFDIGLYPRALDLMGRASIKVLEYMACGVPVVGFAVEEMRPALEAKAGLTAADAAGFAAGLLSLAKDPGARSRLGRNGAKAAQGYNWDMLAGRYRRLLDQIAGLGAQR